MASKIGGPPTILKNARYRVYALRDHRWDCYDATNLKKEASNSLSMAQVNRHNMAASLIDMRKGRVIEGSYFPVSEIIDSDDVERGRL